MRGQGGAGEEDSASFSDGDVDAEDQQTRELLFRGHESQGKSSCAAKVAGIVASAALLASVCAFAMHASAPAEEVKSVKDAVSLVSTNSDKCGLNKEGTMTCPPPGCNCKSKCNQFAECQCDAASTYKPNEWIVCPPKNACNAKGFCPPKGCVCKRVCASWNQCTVITKKGCPGATDSKYGPWIQCKSQKDLANEAKYEAFGKFPNGPPTTFKLPCKYPKAAHGDTPSMDVSPCMYPEVTDAYGQGVKHGIFKSLPYRTVQKRVVNIHAHNFETNGLTPDTKHVFTKDVFEKAIAKINQVGMFKFFDLKPATFELKAPTQAQWTRFTGLGFVSYDTSKHAAGLHEAYEFFNLPKVTTRTPGDIHLFVFPKFDTLGLSSRHGGPNSIFFRESGMRNLAIAADTIAHELGHAFGLDHTFHGLEKAKLETKGTCDKCVPTESNGKTTGDGIADTPPTGSEFADDKFPRPVKDSQDYTKCTMKIDSTGYCTTLPGGHGNMRNIMSYDAMGCRFNENSFTTLQLGRMQCFYEQDMSTEIGPPGMPVLGPASVSNGAVTLGWLPPVSELHCKGKGCVTNYRIARAVHPGGSWIQLAPKTFKLLDAASGSSWVQATKDRTFKDKTVKKGVTYKYRVMAYNGNAIESVGNEVYIVA